MVNEKSIANCVWWSSAEDCEGECLVQGKNCHGLNDVRGENGCLWEHLAPDADPPASGPRSGKLT
jgi:hypothetical protein